MEGCLARKSEGRYQTLREHSERVSLLASRACPKLRAFAALLGLIHDLGKATRAFQRYIREGGERGEVRHAVHGAAFAFRRWRGGDAYRVLCAELIGYAVACHHSRLPDLLTADGDAYDSPEAPPGDLDEAVAAFCEQVASEDQLDALFESAVIEVKALYERIIASCRELPRDQQAQARTYQLGLALREAYSLLIDADRWDAYRFEAGLPIVSPAAPPWADWRARLENRLSSFDQTKPIARRRAQIAGECLAASASGSGVYRLCVPTGGGKTLSSLRMALASAQEAGRPRILYAAPYKAILEQTADTLREVFADDERILVHHGDVVPETLEDEARYRLLTQRWDSPLILTTMVQLLNTLFLGRSACARRFSALRGSVIILDEAQSIPPRLFYMLNMALRYLALCADCMIILCTATQPLLERTARYPLCTPKPVCRDEDALFRAFRRVRLTDQSARALSPDELAARVVNSLPQCGSALVILNTKATARAAYEALLPRLPGGVPVFYLTTSLCPAHRLALLQKIRALLDDRQPVVCVSTQLIEAGVDVSFGLVARALCGLDSLAQAAGRCNRHGEREAGEVLLFRMSGESLKSLPELREGQLRAQTVLDAVAADPARYQGDALSLPAITMYFEKTLRECEREMTYPLDAGCSLFDMLGCHLPARGEYQKKRGAAYPGAMAQAFRTAGKRFRALEVDTAPVLVPYGEGAEIIEALARETELPAINALLRRAQPYQVSVYAGQLRALERGRALRTLPGCFAVGGECYDEQLGLTNPSGDMELMTI